MLRNVLECYESTCEGKIVAISVADEVIEATLGHPFWVIEGQGLAERNRPEHSPKAPVKSCLAGRWVDAGDLNVGDVLLLKHNKRAKISQVAVHQASEKVYNFKVEDLHCYGVGASQVLVHNNSAIVDDQGERDSWYWPWQQRAQWSINPANWAWGPVAESTQIYGKATGLGLGQGGANLINGVQDIGVGVINLPAAAWNVTAGNLGAKTAPYVPSADWSKNLVTEENDTLHSVSKFLTGEGTVTLATMGLAQASKVRYLRNLEKAEKTEQALEVLSKAEKAFRVGRNFETEAEAAKAWQVYQRAAQSKGLIIGKNQEILEHAGQEGRDVLHFVMGKNLPKGGWSWEINKAWLDGAVDSGKSVKLLTRTKELPRSGTLWDEFNYLISKGYRLVDGMLVPP